ncbi:hypothetical protein HG536_0D00420 [Torulaspora globosa]|uniref:Mannosyltransferase n=1 Tax=Torulaspora globosa TaxID=48254 RepID=A0A7G3ZG84_9SACH|nr:uncharacterized protein HG536_0D00420 [Torulaspora globosa]QLL32520.1 hypothetical protein HG536_0D00420 [Torulaspora globosa]
MNCKLLTAVLLLLLGFLRLALQPVVSVISDCDETFNYWEPLNLLVRGFGKQTWEYSPEYAIRSWAFLVPFWGILYPLNKIASFDADWNFYVIRAVLGIASYVLECSVHREIANTLSLKVANSWLVFQMFSPGWFHASVELLPSSVAMLLYLGSIKYALRYLSRNSTSSFLASLTFNVVAGIVGWPFVLVLSVPLCLHYFAKHSLIATMRTAFDSMVIIAAVTTVTVAVDTLFYGKFAPVSWNIFWYNVLNADEESGPNIFGVESWKYYLFNMVLNFPLPVLLLSVVGVFHLKLWPLWTSLLLWLSVFTGQPHKEERFLYPVYALVTLSASVGLSNLLQPFDGAKALKRFFKIATFSTVMLIGLSRIVALTVNYSAPLTVYSDLHLSNSAGPQVSNVCTGREWYHFPNSFFLPDNHRLRFTASGFDGLLPGDFPEVGSIFSKIREVPKGMNKKNIFDGGKIWDADECDYYVDIVIPANREKDAYDPLAMPANWRVLRCADFIDVDHSKIFGRAFYIPWKLAGFMKSLLPTSWDRYYGAEKVEYCLYEKIDIPSHLE